MTLWRVLAIALVSLAVVLIFDALDISARDLFVIVVAIVLIIVGVGLWSRPGRRWRF